MDVKESMKRWMFPTEKEREERDVLEISRLKRKLEKEELKSKLGRLKKTSSAGRWNPDPNHLKFMGGG